MHETRSGRVGWRIAWLLASCCCAGVTAQELDRDPAPLIQPKAYIRGVEVRLPSDMRADEPLLVGIEDNGNGFRSRTPLLAHGRLQPKPVDIDELHFRRLAVYAEPLADAPADPSDAGRDNVPPPGNQMLPPPGAADYSFFRAIMFAFAGILLAGSGAATFWRRHRVPARKAGRSEPAPGAKAGTRRHPAPRWDR